MAHHVVVDEITRRVGPGDDRMTTIRGKTVDGKSSNAESAPKIVLWFYAYYQFCSAGSQLVPSARLADLAYNSLIAIQSNAFLMTLFRKGLIRWYTHAFWYTVALVMGHFIMFPYLGIWFYVKISLMFSLRVNMRMNKYVIWVIYACLSLPKVENMIFEKLTEITPTFDSLIVGN